LYLERIYPNATHVNIWFLNCDHLDAHSGGQFCLSWGTPVRIDLNREKFFAAHTQAQLHCCAESFPNNGDNFGLASEGVLQGYQEQKAIQLCPM